MAIAFVAERAVIGGSTSAFSPASNCTAGNFLVLVFGNTGTGVVTAVSDNGPGLAWQIDQTRANSSFASISVISAYVSSALTTAHTITVTHTGTARGALLEEFSGVASSSWKDKSGSNAGTTSSSMTTGSSGTQDAADDLAIEAFCVRASGRTFAQDAAYTDWTTPQTDRVGGAYKIKSGDTSAENASGAFSGADTDWSGVIVTYKAAGGATQTISPDAVAVPFVVPAPTVSLSLTVSPDPVAVPLVVPAPTVMRDQALAPDPVAVPLVVPVPTVALSLGLTPDPVAVPIAIPAPTVALGAITLTPDPITVPILVPQPTVTPSYGLTPDPVAVPIVVPAPSIALGAITVSPDPVAVPIVVPAPTIATPLTVSPDPVAIPIVLPAPTVTQGGDQTLTPDPVAVPVVVTIPTVTVEQPVVPVVVTIPAGVGRPQATYDHLYRRPPQRIVLRPDPVRIDLRPLRIRRDDEELMIAGIL